MKSLAEFIVKGRFQAMIVAALATSSFLLAWVGAAAVGLFILRFGVNAASFVVISALLPATFWASLGEIGPLLILVGSVALGVVLRIRSDWSLVLFLLPFVLGGLCFLILKQAPGYIDTLQAMSEQFVAQLQEQLRQSQSENEALIASLQELGAPLGVQLMGVAALMQSAMVFLSLILARWWQATLFNPGGFQREFHAIRLDRLFVLPLLACFVLLLGSESYQLWSLVFILPLIIAGVALVHGSAAILGTATHWLALFYVLLVVMVRSTLPLLVALAIADSAFDFRSRLRNMKSF